VTRTRRDGADRLLAGLVRLLPSGRREWGVAMRAELAGIGPRRARWRFAAGCLRVVATRPHVLNRVGYPLLATAALATVLWWTDRIGYAPLRWGVFGLILLLVAVSWLGRRRGPVGPVASDRATRAVRAGGYLLIGTLAWAVVASLDGRDHDPGEQARVGLPVFTVLLTGYLLAYLAVTARRSAATARALTAGAVAGTAAAALWTGVALAVPPVPANIGLALLLVTLAMAGAALAAARREPAARGERAGHPEQSVLAALCAGTSAALLIVLIVGALSTFGAPRLIPDLAPAALTAADDLAQSRVELQDPYLALLFLGWLVALVQTVASLAIPRPARHEAGVSVNLAR